MCYYLNVHFQGQSVNELYISVCNVTYQPHGPWTVSEQVTTFDFRHRPKIKFAWQLFRVYAPNLIFNRNSSVVSLSLIPDIYLSFRALNPLKRGAPQQANSVIQRLYPLSYRVPVRERYGSTLLPATREQHDQNCTQSH